MANLSSEDILAEKLRLQKIQEESDLKSALETFGVSNISSGLDSFDPQSKEEFKEFGATLSWKVGQYKESPHFPQFVEDLVRSICVNCKYYIFVYQLCKFLNKLFLFQVSSADMKKVKINIESLHSEKLKMEKQGAKKLANKAKGKATLRTENNVSTIIKKSL